MEFPQYRRYKNGKSYFKINSEEHFEEYKLLGNSLEQYEFVAKILPDRNYISDMLNEYEMHWDKINEDEFKAFVSQHAHK